MRTLGIILAGGNSKRMRELTKKRAIAAMPMAGSYRAIDFALSSMANSNINRVAVITQYSSRSLNEHLSSSKWWDFGRKQGGLFVFNPTITPDNREWYRGTADALAQTINFLCDCHEPYVVIAAGDGIYKVDYTKVLEEHIARDADITVICKDMPKDADVSRFGVVELDVDGRIVGFDEKPASTNLNTISCGIYVIRRRLLISLLEECIEMEWTDFVRDILMRQKNNKKIYAHKLESYWASINTAEAYFAANQDFLKPEVREWFFRTEPEVMTKVEDNPPAKYNPGAKVSNSLVAGGTIINSEVTNTLVFKNVFIGSGCIIRNSVIMNNVYIGDNCVLENCVVDSRNRIEAGSVFRGTPDHVEIVSGKGK